MMASWQNKNEWKDREKIDEKTQFPVNKFIWQSLAIGNPSQMMHLIHPGCMYSFLSFLFSVQADTLTSSLDNHVPHAWSDDLP